MEPRNQLSQSWAHLAMSSPAPCFWDALQSWLLAQPLSPSPLQGGAGSGAMPGQLLASPFAIPPSHGVSMGQDRLFLWH